MTGEMSRDEVTEENFPIHFAIAKALGGTVHPFDQYQGPYISNFPDVGAKLWLQVHGEGPGFQIYNSINEKLSPITYDSEKLLQIEYAKRVMYGPREERKSFTVSVIHEITAAYTVEAANADEARAMVEGGSGDFMGYGDEHLSTQVTGVEEDDA